MECGVSNDRHISFYWTLDGKPVQNSTRRYQVDSDLRINRVDRHQDIGEFKCVALNATTGISMISQGAQLNIYWIGETAKVLLHSPETEDLLNVGGELILRCKLEGSPEVAFQWYRNGLRLFRNERISFRNGKRLHINPLTIADNGLYSCRGKNDAEIPVESSENFALRLRADDVALIEQLPKDVTAMKNHSALFDCVYDNAATIEWYAHEQDVPLVNNTRYAIFQNGSLLINMVRNSDEGIYRCVGLSASSKDAPQQTYTARLRVAYLQEMGPSTFEPQLEPSGVVVVPQASQYEVTCIRPKGHPNPRIWWEDPNGHVISDNGRIRADETLRLIVEGVNVGDSGNYTCVAENEAGQKRLGLDLIVTVAPSISQNPVNILIDEGEMALLTCEYSGSPYPMTKVNWLREGKYIRPGLSHLQVHLDNGSLVIPHVSLADVGAYACEVNTTGFEPVMSQGASLFVKERLKFVPTPINKNLELGSNSKIYCKARGSTPPIVKWILYKTSKAERPLPPSDWPSHIRDENGTLHFGGVLIEDAGKYVCVATSSQGIINATIRVDVIVTPKFTVAPVNTEAYEGYSSMLHCQADGDPKPTIQWDKNGALNGFDQKRFHVMPNGTLFISEVHKDDNGKYGCTAGNSGGFKRLEISLLVHSAEHLSNAADPGEHTMTKTVAITLGAAAVYMLLVLGLLVWCRMRRAKRKALFLAQATADVAKSENGEVVGAATDTTELKDRPNGVVKDGVSVPNGTKSDGEAHSPSSGSHTSKKSRSSYDRLQFPRQDLQKMMLLGKGEFGDVYLAKAKGIKDTDPETVVMVKALQLRDETLHVEFKREMELYHKLTHDNVAKLLAVCREAEPFLMIIEYSDWGDLKQFLLATRKDNPRKGPRPPPLSLSQIIGICHQVALGMEYVSNHRFTHKDLATRNCLISSKLDIKISSPGLSRDTYAQEYYRYKNKAIPLRWSPPEAVFDDEYSTKSDIWSFAVLVWETFTQAELPFSEVGDEALLAKLQSKELVWSPPDASPDKLRELLTKCWSHNAKERPSFTEAVSKIGELTVDSHL